MPKHTTNTTNLTTESEQFDRSLSLPNEINFIQTATQNFYFFDLGKLERLHNINFNSNYYIIAECNRTTVGYRQLDDKTQIIDVPVMGNDNSSDDVQNYCSNGQTPSFYIYDNKNSIKYDLTGVIIDAFLGTNTIYNVNF